MQLFALLGVTAILTGAPQAAPVTIPVELALPCPLDRPYDPNNPFARIQRGELPAAVVYENRRVIVIMPLEWDHPGHALVIPKRPVRSLLDMTTADMGHALDIARHIGTAQMRSLGATGFTVVQNNARSQHVCHVHFHVIPNTPRAPQNPVPREVLDSTAERLRLALRLN